MNAKRNFQRAGSYHGFHSHSLREVGEILEFRRAINPSSIRVRPKNIEKNTFLPHVEGVVQARLEPNNYPTTDFSTIYS